MASEFHVFLILLIQEKEHIRPQRLFIFRIVLIILVSQILDPIVCLRFLSSLCFFFFSFNCEQLQNFENKTCDFLSISLNQC